MFSALYIIKNINKNLYNRIANKDIRCEEVIEELDHDCNFSKWIREYKQGTFFKAYLSAILNDDSYVNYLKGKTNYHNELKECYEYIRKEMLIEENRKRFFNIISMYEGLEITASN